MSDIGVARSGKSTVSVLVAGPPDKVVATGGGLASRSVFPANYEDTLRGTNRHVLYPGGQLGMPFWRDVLNALLGASWRASARKLRLSPRALGHLFRLWCKVNNEYVAKDDVRGFCVLELEAQQGQVLEAVQELAGSNCSLCCYTSLSVGFK